MNDNKSENLSILGTKIAKDIEMLIVDYTLNQGSDYFNKIVDHSKDVREMFLALTSVHLLVCSSFLSKLIFLIAKTNAGELADNIIPMIQNSLKDLIKLNLEEFNKVKQ